MNKIIAWWADNHVAANLLMLGIIAAGIAGFSKLEREMFPTLPYPGMQVAVTWPGASPRDIEEQIVVRIEESLKDLENLDWVRSESHEGVGLIFIQAEQADDFGRIMDEVESRVSSISSFPPGIEQPRINQWQARNESMRVAVHGDIGEKRLSRLARDIRKEVAGLPHISVVELFGIRKEEISVEVSETALRRYGISFDEIARAIRSKSVNLSAGNVRTQAGNFTLRTRNLANTNVDFENIVVKQLPQGASIRIADVATVIDGFEENEILATLNGEPAILVQVMSSENMDVVLMSKSVNEWLDKRRATLPQGASLTLWQDKAEPFRSRMKTIGTAAFSGLALVMLVLLFTLRPIVAFWVGVGVATAYAGAFVLLPAMGVSLNMLSTFAFLLALGIVVDDAIIIGERVHGEHESGNLGLSGAIHGTQLVSKPVIFGVVTTIIAMLPWVFVSGFTQEFTRQISWVVILALCFSLIEALLILPAHLSTIKPQKSKNDFSKFQEAVAHSIVTFGKDKYGPVLKNSLRRPVFTSIIFLVAFMIGAVGLVMGGFVQTSFAPKIESEEIFINVDLREGTTYETALNILAKLQRAQEQLIDQYESEDGAQVVENWYTRSRRDSVIAIIKLVAADERDISAEEAALRLRELIGPVAEAKEIRVEYELSNSGPDMELSLRHPDLDVLTLAADDLKRKMMGYTALYDVSHNLEPAGDEVRFDLKPGAEKLGLTLAQVVNQIRQAYYGEEVQRLPRDGEDVKVMVRYPLESRRNMESLKHFRVRMNDGREVPLSSVVDVSYAPGLKRIDHWDGLRAAEVRAYVKDGGGNDIMKEIREEYIPQLQIKYPGLEDALIGQSASQQEFMAEIAMLQLLAFAGMYFLLAVAFKSYSKPALILTAVPFAVLGAIIGHFILGINFSIYSFFGTIAAIGVVINDNLVLIDSYNRYRDQGLEPEPAIHKAGCNRFRPILITSVTTFVGLIPLMLETSIQAAFLKPIVVSLAFGLVIAFFVTLFLVPAMLINGILLSDSVRRFFRWIGGIFGSSSEQDQAATLKS